MPPAWGGRPGRNIFAADDRWAGLRSLCGAADPSVPGIWLTEPDHRNAVRFALDLVPFAGIAFLWFIGVLRSRLGKLEDQFFATVMLTSGLLFGDRVWRLGRDAVAQRVDRRQYRWPDLLLRAVNKRHTGEPVCDENGGSLHVLDLHNRTAYRHFPTPGWRYSAMRVPYCCWS